MPVTLSYPGVYTEEIQSPVHPITPLATAITAMIGRAARGRVNEPVTVNSVADFEREFGGLWSKSSLGFAVSDFFLNGGGQALIVRLHHGATKALLDANGLELDAVSEGAWGNQLRARIDDNVAGDLLTDWQKDFPNLLLTDIFNLTVRDMATGATEQLRNVTVAPSPRVVDAVLASESSLVRVHSPLPGQAPAPHAAPAAGKTVWEDDNASDGVATPNAGGDGDDLAHDDFVGSGNEAGKEGLYALEKADLFNLLCIPPYAVDSDGVPNAAVQTDVITQAATYCERRLAMLIVDAPSTWHTKTDASTGGQDFGASVGTSSKNAALFFPRIRRANPFHGNQREDFAASGAIAGIFARTDTERGVWKAPAGLDAVLVGASELSVPLSDAENGELNELGINCLRTMPSVGRVVWGARTLQGADRLASEWKYVPVRRTALMIELNLLRGTQWAVFEPNDERLWAQLRLNVGAFMHDLFRQGAFQGTSARDAYFVKCDKETTTQTDQNNGVVNLLGGAALVRPAEFVVIKVTQMAGQIEV
jgi:uncharacterized protein